MPIYEYQCDACGHQLEALQKMSDPKLTTCPECEQESLRKRVSAAAFRFKGGGWYETDFKDKKSQKRIAGRDEPGSGDKDKKKDKESGDSKPEKKTDNKKSETSGKGKPAKTETG